MPNELFPQSIANKRAVTQAQRPKNASWIVSCRYRGLTTITRGGVLPVDVPSKSSSGDINARTSTAASGRCLQVIAMLTGVNHQAKLINLVMSGMAAVAV